MDSDSPVLLDDQQMECLRATLLAKGKGRRPSLPPLVVNNKLLYQLHLLRLEANMPTTQLQVWFNKLFPESAYPADRFSRQIERVAERFAALNSNDEPQFLLTRVDFDFISAALDAQNVTKLLNKANFKVCCLTNELVLDLHHHFKVEQYSRIFFHDILSALSSSALNCTPNALLKKTTKLELQRRKYIKRKAKAPELANFLKQPFIISTEAIPEPAQPQPTSLESAQQVFTPHFEVQPQPKSTCSESTQISTIATPQGQVQPTCSHSESAPFSAATSSVTQPHLTCSNTAMNKESLPTPRPDILRVYIQKAQDAKDYSKKLEDELKIVKDMYKKSDAELADLKSSCVEIRSKLQSVTQKKCEIDSELNELKKTGLYKCVQKLRQKVRGLNLALAEIDPLKEKVECLEQDKIKLQKKIHILKKARNKFRKQKEDIDADFLREIARENTDFVPPLKFGNRFTDEVRRTVIALMSQCNVSATQCSKVIQAVASELFKINWTLTDLPSPQTLLTIADEAHVLAKLATVEEIKAASQFTLHMDGTSRHQRKYVGHQITLDNGKVLSLGFVDVPCEDSATLLEVTTAVLTELGDIYDPENKEKVFKEILHKMHSTMTDRASAMKKFVSSLETMKKGKLGEECELHFLHCNAHFLLGLSSSSEAAIKQVENCEITRKLGRDLCPKFKRFHTTGESAVARYIRTSCAILGPRGDQKSGCRVEWLAFCEEKEFHSHLPSYRSNRFNCYFEAAARLVQHHEMVQYFLNGNFLSHNNLLIDSVREDCKDGLLMCLVAVLAFFYLEFTGPYWQLLQSKTPFAELYIKIQGMEKDLEKAKDRPLSVLNSDANWTSTLSSQFPQDATLKASVLSFITSLPEETRQPAQSAVVSISQAFLEVLRRQLCDFLHGGKFDFTSRDSPLFLHCPLTNLVGENAFGDFDFITSKHRRASIFHVSSMQIAKQNQVSKWLKKTHNPKAAMAHARKYAAHFREAHRKREKEVMLAVRRKMLKNVAEQEERLAKQSHAKQAIIKSVLDHGGPCTSAMDVVALLKRLPKGQHAEALKQEIRYQKVVLCAPGLLKLTKPTDELCQQLKEHLSSSTSTISADENSSHAAPGEDHIVEAVPTFTFERPSIWVAVYYDNTFYDGQVITVLQPNQAEIKFLEQTKVRKDYFRWPRADDIAIVDAEFVFAWNFEVSPVSSDCRVWQVPNITDLIASYERIRNGYQLH